jgi:hypothetical protein
LIGVTHARLLTFRRLLFFAFPSLFAFSSGTSSLLFCNVAKDRASQERLFKYLQRFDQTFPNHPSLPAAMLQLATLALDRFSDPKIAKEALAKVATYSPVITQSQEYRRLMALCSA